MSSFKLFISSLGKKYWIHSPIMQFVQSHLAQYWQSSTSSVPHSCRHADIVSLPRTLAGLSTLSVFSAGTYLKSLSNWNSHDVHFRHTWDDFLGRTRSPIRMARLRKPDHSKRMATTRNNLCRWNERNAEYHIYSHVLVSYFLLTVVAKSLFPPSSRKCAIQENFQKFSSPSPSLKCSSSPSLAQSCTPS